MNAKIVLVTMDSVLTNLLNMSVSVIQALISPPTVGMVNVTLLYFLRNLRLYFSFSKYEHRAFVYLLSLFNSRIERMFEQSMCKWNVQRSSQYV